MMVFLLFLFQEGVHRDFKIGTAYANPADVSDDYLSQPHDIDFDENGRLLVVDAKINRVFIWAEDGSFIRAFGTSGEGPGELRRPQCIGSIGNQIWVYDGSRVLHLFNAKGTYVRSVRPKSLVPRVFAVVSENLALVGTRQLDPDGDHRMAFYSIDLNDGTTRLVRSWKNETVMRVKEDTHVRWRAFGDDLDIDKDEKGTVYFGFSQTKTLLEWKMGSDPSPWLKWGFENSKPTDADRQQLSAITFPGNSGSRFSFSDMPNWKWDYSRPKGSFTHFTLNPDKVLFILTPLGSIQGVGAGFSRGSYVILERPTGEPLARGSFHFPQDSLIFYERGNIVGFVMGDDGEYQVLGLNLKGF